MPALRILAILSIAFVTSAATGDIIHVPGDHPTIQAAINAADDGDEIIVASGTYNELIDLQGKAIHLHSSAGPTATTITAAGLPGSVVTITSGEGPATILEGFRLTAGTGTPSGSNVAGGGMFIEASSPIIRDCIFFQNQAEVGGGAFSVGSTPLIDNCVFQFNLAALDGGGFSDNEGSSSILRDCLFVLNSAGFVGGAIIVHEAEGTMIDSCTFRENEADEAGGALFVWNSGTTLQPITIRTSVLETNTATDSSSFGGGIYVAHSSMWLIATSLLGNEADDEGGAIYLDNSTVTLANSIMSGNRADSAISSGGAIHLDSGFARLVNSTVANNYAANGAGIRLSSSAEAEVANSIFWGNGPGAEIQQTFSGTAEATYSLIQGGFPGVGNISANPQFIDPLGPDGVVGTGDDDLRLQAGSPAIDAANDNLLPFDIFDLDGDGDTLERIPYDADENPREVDDPETPDTGFGTPPIVDMGAYEYQPGILGDIDGDGVVGFTDLIHVLNDWGPCPPPPATCPADIDGDGSVGLTDLLTVLDNWT